MSASLTFRLVDFNPRRHARKAEAARVYVIEDGEIVDLLWMSKRDVTRNLAMYPGDPGLAAALAAYATPTREIRALPISPAPDNDLSGPPSDGDCDAEVNHG